MRASWGVGSFLGAGVIAGTLAVGPHRWVRGGLPRSCPVHWDPKDREPAMQKSRDCGTGRFRDWGTVKDPFLSEWYSTFGVKICSLKVFTSTFRSNFWIYMLFLCGSDVTSLPITLLCTVLSSVVSCMKQSLAESVCRPWSAQQLISLLQIVRRAEVKRESFSPRCGAWRQALPLVGWGWSCPSV